MVEKVPADEHDVRMDVVVTENGHYPPGPLPRWASDCPLQLRAQSQGGKAGGARPDRKTDHRR